MLLPFKKKAIIFTYHHPKLSKKISVFRSSILEIKKILK